MANSINYHFEDFTEERYQYYLDVIKQKWRFEFYSNVVDAADDVTNHHCLLRHDLDISLERARRISEIENQAGVRATYFVHLHSSFYNPIEIKSILTLKNIAAQGHELGLHFDVFYYQQRGKLLTQCELEEHVIREKKMFEEWFEVPCRVISFHNPDNGTILDYSSIRIADLINASSDLFRTEYEYISDSNGYWRFKRLEDFLLTTSSKRIHVLTHPEWWSRDVLSTEGRFDSAILERAHQQMMDYKLDLKKQGRKMP